MNKLALWLWLAAGCAHHARTRAPTPPLAHAACAATPADDLSRLVGAKVARVDVRGDVEPTAYTLETRPGAPLDPETLRGDVRRLWALGVASQITIDAEPSPDGYAIELVLEPPPRVAAVELDGARPDQLAAFANLEGTLHDPARLARLATAATAWWRAHGYLHAEIAARSRVACGEAVIRVTASLGRRYTLARLDVAGSEVPAPAAMFERELGAVNRAGGAYDAALFAVDVDALVQRHHRRGWLDARADPIASETDEASGRVTASVRVIAGTRYRFGKLALDGGSPATRAAFAELVAPLRGQWYDDDALEDARRRFEDRAGEHSIWWKSSFANGSYDLTVEVK